MWYVKFGATGSLNIYVCPMILNEELVLYFYKSTVYLVGYQILTFQVVIDIYMCI